MPFSGNCQSFDASTLKELNDDRAVYGLFKRDLPFHSHHFICLYVGQTDHLRTRMLDDYNKPPIAGVTNFFSEAVTTERQGKEREGELIREFSPIGNPASDASLNRTPNLKTGT
jgi:hypothetical protein